jgi:DNA-binding GntR family transcriptional regulator
MRNLADKTVSAETLDHLYDVIFDLLRPKDSHGLPTAVDHAYEIIWRQLMKGEKGPGERLTDTELASQLGLSRTPVRQALHRLAQEELVRLDARRGFTVRAFAAQDVHEIYEVRGALEVLAVRLAAPHLTADQVQKQLRRLHEVRAALESTQSRTANIMHLQADLEFHNLIIQTSGNGRLIRALAALRSQQTLFQYWDASYPRRNEAAGYEHERILLALATGDIVQATEQMAQHIHNAKARVLSDLFGLTDALPQRGDVEEDRDQLTSPAIAGP